MMNVFRCGHTFSHRDLLQLARYDAFHHSATHPIPTDGDSLAKKRIFRPILPKGRHTKEWTTIAWPTNIQSKRLDGKFGPAKQMKGWNDCWFLTSLAAVANDQDGQKILAESIKQVNGGYDVTFKGSPNNNVFISNSELDKCLDENGGDADSRLLELAADKFFKESGNYESLYIATLMRGGMNQKDAEQCFQILCSRLDIQDPMTHSPMRAGAFASMGFFMFTGMYPDESIAGSGTTLLQNDVMRFLNTYITDDRDGASVVIGAIANPLGESRDAWILVGLWDVIRTEITCKGRLLKQQRAFLNALDKWLATGSSDDLQVLMTAAGNLNLEHIDPVEFVKALARNLINMNQKHVNLLRSGVRKVLGGGSGYIGFPGRHAGIIEGINAAAGTFSYSDPSNPTVVHTGELSGLIQAIISGNAFLNALKPTTRQDEGESSHAGEKRGRHLRQIHNQVVRDGKIDPAESGPLANLMEMDDSAFWQVYDRDNNGVIEGGELKALQLRVNRWVDHLELTPIW